MAETAIEWTSYKRADGSIVPGYTFNPVRGCERVSPACDHCYAEAMSRRNPAVLGEWGAEGKRAIAAESYWQYPLRWNKEAAKMGERRRVFCASLADVFEDHPAWIKPRRRLFDLIDSTSNLDWLLLTKRPENIRGMLLKTPWNRCSQCGAFSDLTDEEQREDLFQLDDDEDGWECRECGVDVSYDRLNVWMGTTVENQEQANKRIPHLLNVPARVRFLSCEPLLGPLDLRNINHRLCDEDSSIKPVLGNVETYDALSGGRIHGRLGYDSERIDWVIAGGESGSHARPSHADWFRALRNQCQQSGVAFHFKQFGEWSPNVESFSDAQLRARDRTGGVLWDNHAPQMVRVGKKAAGRLLDGRTWDESPKASQ